MKLSTMAVLIIWFIAEWTVLTNANSNWSAVPGKLTQLDVNTHDILWGVNHATQNVYIRNGSEWSQVTGAFTHVTAGEAGVWGVDISHNIYYREGVTLSSPQGSSWTKVSGKLIQIDSGPSGIVYGVNSHHMIFCRRAITPRRPKGRGWQRVPGALKYVSCGIYGCWGVNNNNQTWFRHDVTGKNCVGSKWVRISGSRSKLGVDKTGKVYGINHEQKIFVRDGVSSLFPTGTNWRHIPSPPALVHISAGYSKVVALDSAGAIYIYHVKNQRNTATTFPGHPKQIDHGLTAEVWGVNNDDTIYRLKNNIKPGWKLIPGSLKHVSAGEAGIWGVDRYDDVFYRNGVTKRNPSGKSWQNIPGKLKQIDSGPSGIVYGVNVNDQIFCRTGIDSSTPFGTAWKQVTSYGKLKYVSCGVLGCWGVNSGDGIWYRTGITKENCAGTRWSSVFGRLKQIEVGAAGDVYGTDSVGNIYRRSGITELRPMGSGWQIIQENGSHVTTGLNGQYLLVNGQIQYSNNRLAKTFINDSPSSSSGDGSIDTEK